MKNWEDFLTRQGAVFSGKQVISFGEALTDNTNVRATLSVLNNLGALTFDGPDTERFLQGQCTNDMRQLDDSNALPGSICTPKGRMLTSFYAVKPDSDKIVLMMDRGIIPSTAQTLTKYAAFFKTTMTDSSDAYRFLGISGPDCEQTLQAYFEDIPQQINQVHLEKNTLLLRQSRFQFILAINIDVAENLWLSLIENFKPVGINYWQLQSIDAGIAHIQEETVEEFVPQMLNLQATGGISFKKGCYTGQEIVARMQYLGKLKRRTYHLRIKSTDVPEVGTTIKNTEGKIIGQTLLAAKRDQQHIELLAVLQRIDSSTHTLFIGDKEKPIQLIDLPYELDLKTKSSRE